MNLYESLIAVRCADGLWRAVWEPEGGDQLRAQLLTTYATQTMAEARVTSPSATVGPTLIHVMSRSSISPNLPAMIGEDHYVFENGQWFFYDPHEGEDGGVILPLAAYVAHGFPPRESAEQRGRRLRDAFDAAILAGPK